MKPSNLVWAVFFLLAITPFSFGQTNSTKTKTTEKMVATPKPLMTGKNNNYSNALIIHKPATDPSWGKIIQYKREQITSLSTKGKETVYEFVFQDDQGVIRTTIYHENDSGDGYWEVLVWDQT